MTPEQRRLILSLTETGSSREEFLRLFGAPDGCRLGLVLLRDAVAQRDALGVELALIVCFSFGFTADHLELLVELCSADWHRKHEDVVTALGQLRTPAAVDALYEATQWVPAYLDFDDSRALATKAVWALGGTPGDEAERALERLLGSESEIVREGARRQLARRNS